MNHRTSLAFSFLIALSLLLVGRSEAQFFLSPEPFGVYKSFPSVKGNVIYRNPDAVTLTIMRDGQSWDGSGWITPTFTQPKRQLATTVVGNDWSYTGALPKEDGVYRLSVTFHSGNSGSGGSVQIRVESGRNPSLTSTTPPDINGTLLPLASFAMPQFKPVVKIGVGEHIRKVAIADFNGDKQPDMVLGSGYNRISILQGDGKGNFSTAGIFPVEKPPSAIATGDFNNDDKTDVAVAHSNGNSVSIFLGDGAGQLGVPTSVDVGDGPLDVVAHDFNRDGKLDLATANYGANIKTDTVSILLGNGTGQFQTMENVVVGNGPGGIAVKDFNADGKPDLAITNHHSNDVSILLGTESGFRRASEIAVGENPGHIVASDFNADGKVDLATANGHRWSNRQHSISILMGDGRGGFKDETLVLAGIQPQSIVAADFNDDGKTDLCIADAPLDRVLVLLGNGKGGFSTPVVQAVGTNPMFLAVADFNADTKPDIAAVVEKSIAVLVRGLPRASVGQVEEKLEPEKLNSRFAPPHSDQAVHEQVNEYPMPMQNSTNWAQAFAAITISVLTLGLGAVCFAMLLKSRRAEHQKQPTQPQPTQPQPTVT